MSGIVRDHALKNIWCTPDQDRLIQVDPHRITVDGGAYKTVRVLWEHLTLPSNHYYHVYQIGQVPPVLYNLPILKDEWLSLTDIPNTRNMVVRVFAENGIVYPIGLGYLRLTKDNNVILALRIERGFPLDLDQNKIWLFLYSNAFFNSVRWNELKASVQRYTAEEVKYIYRHILNAGDLVAFHQEVINAIANSTIDESRVIFSINGRYTDRTHTVTDVLIGDFVEAIIDSSVKEVRHVKLSEMASFNSLLEPKAKRFFPPVRTTDTIDFIDDIDFFLTHDHDGRQCQGLYYHKLVPDAVRMVTHNSYSFSDTQLQALFHTDPEFVSDADVTVTAVIRHAGYRRPLILENNRVSELYKLELSDILSAMVGVESTIPEWRADRLEASAYMKIVSSFEESITDLDCEIAYGYNLLTSIFCDPYPPLAGPVGAKTFDKPIGIYQPVVTSYADGHMVTTINGSQGVTQPVPTPQTNVSMVELLHGQIVNPLNPNRWYGTIHIPQMTDIRQREFRTYVCSIENNVPQEDWIDITDQTDFYSISNNGLQFDWNYQRLASFEYYPLLIVGGFIDYRLVDLSQHEQGYVNFEIRNTRWLSPVGPSAITATPILNEAVIRVPTGSLDVFMDGESLIEGIDYKVIWPTVVITKKPNRTIAEGLQVHYRAYDFAGPNLERNVAREQGFVEGGILSANGVRDLRNDRNIRIVVGGRCLRRNEVRFAEDGAALVNGVLNGKPYSIFDIVMPIEGFTSQSTGAFRALSLDIDQRIGAYMTQKNPGTAPPAMNPVQIKYDLHSPFCSTVIDRLRNGWLDGELDRPYTNVDIANWVYDFINLLDYDPCLDTTLDLRYLFIRPHLFNEVITLTQVQYRFVERIIRDYLTPAGHGPRTDISAYVNIQG